MSEEFVEVSYPGGQRVRTIRCAGFDSGQQCTEPGTISTHGGLKDRYCWKHAKPHLHPQGSAPPGGFQSLKSVIQHGANELDFKGDK